MEPHLSALQTETKPASRLEGGVVHDLPHDLEESLLASPKAQAAWEEITPLARNEWICWVDSAKKAEIRSKRIAWGVENLEDGKRRPCCWPGCPHRERTGRAPPPAA